MVTVITTTEELQIPVNSSVNRVDSNDHEQQYQLIRDYQEVDFYQSPSCRPLPDNLLETVDGHISKSSIEGIFFVQIDAIEVIGTNQKESTNEHNRILLTLTDGFIHIKAITNDHIPSLNFNTKIGSKLLLTNVIPIKDNLLQLTHKNTQFQHGSNTYAQPRLTRRGRGGGTYRSSHERRHKNRYDIDDNENNIFNHPPPKSTLMDFMTSFHISNDNEKSKERNNNYTRRRINNEQYNSTNTTNKSNYSTLYSLNNNNNCNDLLQQDEIDGQFEPDEDFSHANHRERRNPLPPRFQRAQEQRTRRNINRDYHESISGNNINSIHCNHITSNQSFSSVSSSNVSHGDHTLSIPQNISTGQPHTTSYVQPANILTAVHNSRPSQLPYFQNPVTYGFTPIPSSPYHNHQPLINHPYSNEPITLCCGTPYGTPAYVLPTAPPINFNSDTKNYTCTYSDNETAINTRPQNDENNDSGIKSEFVSIEPKQTSSLSNDNNTNFRDEKRRNLNSHTRPRWKIGDMCLARWNDDGEFYYATIMEIRPPYCTVLYHDYYHLDQVRFSDLKMISSNRHNCPFVLPTSDLNISAANFYFPPRTNYYPTAMDNCIIMPEPPPFPFNSAGTLYMYPTPMTSGFHSDRCNTNGTGQQVQQSVTVNSSSSDKDANDRSDVDSATTLLNDDNEQHDSLLPRPCSIADAPLTLVTSDYLGEQNEHTESLPSSKPDEQQSTKEEEQNTEK